MENFELEMPKPDKSGWIPTLNKMGFMTPSLDPFSKEFVKLSASAESAVMEVGAAYGNATLAALERGARVIANDIDRSHLSIIEQRAPESRRGRLSIVCGAVPDDVSIGDSTLSAILCARVLHFFAVPQLQRTAQALARWLRPGGKVFIVEDTPYLGNSQPIIAQYQARLDAGDLWPGYVEDVYEYRSSRNEWCPRRFHFFDVKVLSRLFQDVGLVVERCEFFARTDYPTEIQLDGREGVGLIATKPCL